MRDVDALGKWCYVTKKRCILMFLIVLKIRERNRDAKCDTMHEIDDDWRNPDLALTAS